MKKLLRTLSISAISCLSFQSYAGPFGLEQGMTLEQLKKIAKIEEMTKFVYTTKSLPLGSSEIDNYVLLVAPNIGLCKVTAWSRQIATSANGAQLKTEFNSYAKLLAEKYGAATDKYDFLHANSIWKDPKYWMQSLDKNERELVYLWTANTKKPLPDSLQGIDLRVDATSTTSGLLSVAYEYKNMKRCIDAMENNEKQTKKDNMKNF